MKPNPVAPLWGFFNFIRNRSATPLGIDQYFYMLKALHLAPKNAFQNATSLLNFTKLFWLNDPNYSKEYEFHFRHFFPWDSWLDKVETPKTEQQKPSSKKDNQDEKQPESLQTDVEEEKQDTPKVIESNIESEHESVDFELVLRDSNQAPIERESFTNSLDHSYVLSDHSIMPFDIRNFVQRLRRKVETADQVQSDNINVPAMVEDYVSTGFIDEVIYEIEDASHSNVVLLSDRHGSMLAYDYLDFYFQTGLRQIPHCHFQYYSFYNLPQRKEVGNHYILKSPNKQHSPLDTAWHKWNHNTWFFIFSDAGAHSGMVNRDRIRESLKMWRYFRHISEHTVWINPVPFKYLNDCTAKRLQMTIPMINPDQKSLNEMIFHAKSSR